MGSIPAQVSFRPLGRMLFNELSIFAQKIIGKIIIGQMNKTILIILPCVVTLTG